MKTLSQSVLTFAFISFQLASQQAVAAPTCRGLFDTDETKIKFTATGPAMENPELEFYDGARVLETPMRSAKAPHEHGWVVLKRDQNGAATAAQVRLLVNNAGYDNQIYIVGPFNNWGKSLRPGDAAHPSSDKPYIFTANIDGITNGTPYRILLNGKQVLDPSAMMYNTTEYAARMGSSDTHLNSVFWDAQDPRHYQSQTNFVDIADRPNLIGEVELHSLVAKFKNASGQLGPNGTANTYRYIAESGVVAKMREAGYTAIEMMPINQSVDGDSWHLRYQVYGLFAPDSRYGDPSEFKMMVDEFHRNGIAVIMDSVISHFPFKGNAGDRSLQGVSLDQWYKADGGKLFAGVMSPWDTLRYDYANPYLRRFLIDSITFMMSEYKVDGVRMDNVDGILGEPGGADLLKDLAIAVRNVNPRALMVGEAFFPPDSLLQREDKGGFGFSTRNDSNFFDIWHNQLQGPTEQLDMNAISHILNAEFDWKQAPMMRYLTNHDEAANGRGGFTGAYPATLISGDPYYAFGKTKAADSLNMLSGAYHVSIPQARMMQQGTFYSNAEVDWAQTTGGRGKNLWDYFGALSRYMQAKPSFFNFRSLSRDITNHVDNDNKVISLKRRDPKTGKEIFILINLGDRRVQNYAFGIDQSAQYRIGFDSEWTGFGGDGALENILRGGSLTASTQGAHGKPYSLVVPVMAPYSVTIFEAQ